MVSFYSEVVNVACTCLITISPHDLLGSPTGLNLWFEIGSLNQLWSNIGFLFFSNLKTWFDSKSFQRQFFPQIHELSKMEIKHNGWCRTFLLVGINQLKFSLFPEVITLTSFVLIFKCLFSVPSRSSFPTFQL